MAQNFTRTGAASVSWTLEGNTTSSITTGGALTVAAGETTETIVVKAADTAAGSSKYGTAVVTVTAAGSGGDDGGGQNTTLTIVPTTAVEKGGVRQFWAKDNGTTITSGVAWSVSDASSGSSTNITPSGGLLTVDTN